MPPGGYVDLSNLFRRCHDNEAGAWEEFHAWFHRMAATVLARFPNLTPLEREEAEDTARENVSREIIAVNRVKARTNWMVISYVKTIITNSARDVWRRRRPKEPLPPFLRDNGPTPLDEATWEAQLRCAERVIKSWSPENRFVFIMNLERVTSASVKSDLEYLFRTYITIDAVDVRLFRLRAELRKNCLEGKSRG